MSPEEIMNPSEMNEPGCEKNTNTGNDGRRRRTECTHPKKDKKEIIRETISPPSPTVRWVTVGSMHPLLHFGGTRHIHSTYTSPNQVDVCQLGSLGPKAIVGDIPALLGGVQPASVVAKTPLRVLQCRADKFAAHLDHNMRAKIGGSRR